MNLRWKSYKDLTPYEIHEILGLRKESSVRAQDESALHFLATVGEEQNVKLVAYSNILPPKGKGQELELAPIILMEKFRGRGYEAIFLKKVMEKVNQDFPQHPAQVTVKTRVAEHMHEKYGFETIRPSFEKFLKLNMFKVAPREMKLSRAVVPKPPGELLEFLKLCLVFSDAFFSGRMAGMSVCKQHRLEITFLFGAAVGLIYNQIYAKSKCSWQEKLGIWSMFATGFLIEDHISSKDPRSKAALSQWFHK